MLKGKTAVVTGSTSGIGLGIAEALAAAGCNVVLNSFTDTRDDHALAERLAGQHGVKANYIRADMSKPAECRALVDAGGGAFGPVDNPGQQCRHPACRAGRGISARRNGTRSSRSTSPPPFTRPPPPCPPCARRSWGRIVNIASAHGLTASPFKSAYVAAKHGIVGFTKTVALELAEEGVTCNAICPGYVLTPMVENQIADQMKVHDLPRERVVKEVMLQRQPTREFARVEEIGALTVFLCSDAAAQITGTTLSIDGGWTAL